MVKAEVSLSKAKGDDRSEVTYARARQDPRAIYTVETARAIDSIRE